jgi:hypothetical protein
MPSKEEWIRVHADLMEKLKLPCVLRFSSSVSIASHSIEAYANDPDDFGRILECRITINTDVDFRRPEHLILHEAAHHRSTCYAEWECGDQHCEHWAQTLCDMYKETGVALPQTTSFFEFAKAAGIIRKNFATEGDDA